MSHWGEAEAAAFLTAAGFGAGPFAVRRLAGVLWNDVMRVEAGGRTMVLKHYAEVLPGTLFPNLPVDEAMALQRLDGLEVAPEFIGFWEQDGVLLYGYVAGAVWMDDVEAVALLMRRQAMADATGFRIVPVTGEKILANAEPLFARCGDGDLVTAWRRARPEPVDAGPVVRRLIHTDVGAGNLIGTGTGLRLIDWQCPAAGGSGRGCFTVSSLRRFRC